MNIGINLLAFLPGISGGIELYAHNLLTALAKQDNKNRYFLFTNLDNYEAFEIKKDNFHRIKVSIHARPRVLRATFEQIVLPFISRRFNLDVFHSPSYTFPALCGVPGVVTICDMLYKIYPRAIPKWKLMFWKGLIPISAKRCKKVLTLSEASGKDIIRQLQISAKKVTVTPLALDGRLACTKRMGSERISEVCFRYGISRPYMLNVGGMGMHKNSKILIKAIYLLHQREETRNLTLVITGRDYGSKHELELEISRLGLYKYVVLPGYIPWTDLPPLYAGAEIYITPSLMEGFGFTVLEAMNFGVPVVISNRHSLPEVAGGAALIVDPTNPDEVVEAVRRVVLNPKLREDLILRGFRRIKEFSWDKTAALTLAAYQAAARNKDC